MRRYVAEFTAFSLFWNKVVGFFCNKIKLYLVFFLKGALLKECASRNKGICNIPNQHTYVTVYCKWILFVIIYTRKKETNRIK